MYPIIQIALDTTTLDQALDYGRIAVKAGVDWIEVGTPLVTFEGVKSIKTLAKEFPKKVIVADYKCLDGVKKYFIAAGNLGARVATVCGIADDAAILEAIKGAKEVDILVTVDLIYEKNVLERAREVEALGADHVMLHWGFDQSNYNPDIDPYEKLEKLVNVVNIPVATNTNNVQDAIRAVKMGARIIVQPFLSWDDPEKSLGEFVEKTKNSFSKKSFKFKK